MGSSATPWNQLKKDDLEIGIAAMNPKRAKRGRPKKPHGKARDCFLGSVRLTVDELAHIEEQAATAGLPVSAYARLVLTGRKVAPRQTPIEQALLVELNRSGVNVHQIAKHLNFGNGVPNDITAVLEEHRLALEKVVAAYGA
ncbi:MAG: hypothetical protein GY761_16090 [Hyphomicrobiales bacterium]|nr:hypothetical protein [Hyphomicrobiales bacterium]